MHSGQGLRMEKKARRGWWLSRHGREYVPARAASARLELRGVSKKRGDTACGQTEWPWVTDVTLRAMDGP